MVPDVCSRKACESRWREAATRPWKAEEAGLRGGKRVWQAMAKMRAAMNVPTLRRRRWRRRGGGE